MDDCISGVDSDKVDKLPDVRRPSSDNNVTEYCRLPSELIGSHDH